MNDVNLTSLQRKQRARLQLLRALYDESDGDTSAFVTYEGLYGQTGLPRNEAEAAFTYLVEEGLAVRRTIGHCGITQSGVHEIEDASAEPDHATEHFQSVVVQQVFHGPVGAVQTGPGAVANVQQNIGTMPDKLVELFAQLREQTSALPDATQRADVAELVDDLEAEAKKEKRNEMRLKMLSTGLSTISTLTPIVRMILGVLGVHIPG